MSNSGGRTSEHHLPKPPFGAVLLYTVGGHGGRARRAVLRRHARQEWPQPQLQHPRCYASPDHGDRLLRDRPSTPGKRRTHWVAQAWSQSSLRGQFSHEKAYPPAEPSCKPAFQDRPAQGRFFSHAKEGKGEEDYCRIGCRRWLSHKHAVMMDQQAWASMGMPCGLYRFNRMDMADNAMCVVNYKSRWPAPRDNLWISEPLRENYADLVVPIHSVRASSW